jgi:hypothetical protein
MDMYVEFIRICYGRVQMSMHICQCCTPLYVVCQHMLARIDDPYCYFGDFGAAEAEKLFVVIAVGTCRGSIGEVQSKNATGKSYSITGIIEQVEARARTWRQDAPGRSG